MRRSFGAECIDDGKMLKFTLIIFSASYALRITEDLLLVLYEGRVEQYSATLITALRLVSWILWDLIPILCLFCIHFDNFGSYKNEEILYCEYSDDARTSTTTFADFLFRETSGDKDEESLFKKTLPVASSSQFNS